MFNKEGVDLLFYQKFNKSLEKLPQNIQNLARQKIIQFIEYPNHAGLHIHKLHGKQYGLWSFWVNYEYRIIFVIIENEIRLLDIGTHDIYE